jgi:hypothetical protein
MNKFLFVAILVLFTACQISFAQDNEDASAPPLSENRILGSVMILPVFDPMGSSSGGTGMLAGIGVEHIVWQRGGSGWAFSGEAIVGPGMGGLMALAGKRWRSFNRTDAGKYSYFGLSGGAIVLEDGSLGPMFVPVYGWASGGFSIEIRAAYIIPYVSMSWRF